MDRQWQASVELARNSAVGQRNRTAVKEELVGEDRDNSIHTAGPEVEGAYVCIRCGDRVPSEHPLIQQGTSYRYTSEPVGQGRRWWAVPANGAEVAAFPACEVSS